MSKFVIEFITEEIIALKNRKNSIKKELKEIKAKIKNYDTILNVIDSEKEFENETKSN